VPRAVIVASGDLDNLPREIQTVANELSAAGWRVRLCIGGDASRVGLLQAAGEGDCDLAWFGLHSSSAGFELSDGTWPASQMGVWLRNVNCRDVVLNSCYSSEHVDMIQRAAEVNAAVAIDPAGVDDTLAWQVGVYLVRSYIISENLQSAVRQASGMGTVQYRYIPAGGMRVGEGRRRMPADRIEEQLKELLDVVKGDWRQPGLLPRFNELSVQLATIANEHRQWREEVEHRLASMERERFIQVSPRLMSFGVAFGVVVAVVLLFLLLRLGGTI
jgi:hypothetical protein